MLHCVVRCVCVCMPIYTHSTYIRHISLYAALYPKPERFIILACLYPRTITHGRKKNLSNKHTKLLTLSLTSLSLSNTYRFCIIRSQPSGDRSNKSTNNNSNNNGTHSIYIWWLCVAVLLTDIVLYPQPYDLCNAEYQASIEPHSLTQTKHIAGFVLVFV